MRRAYIGIIILCILYLLAGFVATLFDWFLLENYLIYAGIVGALASVIGLLSFFRSSKTKIDVEGTEADTLQSIAVLMQEYQELKKEKTKAEGEIEELDIRRKEMEILVRKASLSLFLREQLSYHEKSILNIVGSDSDLSKHLNEVQSISKKLVALNEEIEANPNVSLLQEVMNSAGERQSAYEDTIASLPTSIRLIIRLLELLLGGAIPISLIPRR